MKVDLYYGHCGSSLLSPQPDTKGFFPQGLKLGVVPFLDVVQIHKILGNGNSQAASCLPYPTSQGHDITTVAL